MPKVLSEEAVARYRRDGYLCPIDIFSPEEAADYRQKLEAFETLEGGPLKGAYRYKTHLLFTWLDALVRDPRILDVVEDILGPNLLCWASSFFIKEAGDPGFVSWHQDSTYWGLSEPAVMTVWVAFSPSSEASGCMQVVPGSHLRDQVDHRDTFDKNNLLTRGQEIAVDVTNEQTAMMPLEPGQVSLHHVRIFHASPPNRSDDRRIGFAIRYIPTHVKQIVGKRDSAMLVRGVDDFHNFDEEERPTADVSEAAKAQHAAVVDMQMQVLYRDTDRTGPRA